jgi:hypothetical protein
MYGGVNLPLARQQQCKLIVKTGAVLGNNGVWSGGTEDPANNISFMGTLMPLSRDDIKNDTSGSYTPNDGKIYTSFILTNGQEIYDNNNVRWRVSGTTDNISYGFNFNIYVVKKVSVTAQ